MSDVQIQISDDQILRSDDQTLRSDGQISQTEVIWGIKKQEQEQEQQEQEQLYKDVEARQHSCSRLKNSWKSYIGKYLRVCLKGKSIPINLVQQCTNLK